MSETTDYWANRMETKLKVRMEQSQKAIDAVVHRPTPRRRNTKDILADFNMAPNEFDPGKRAGLMQYLNDTYGTAARHLAPFVMPTQEPDPMGEGPLVIGQQEGFTNEPNGTV